MRIALAGVSYVRCSVREYRDALLIADLGSLGFRPFRDGQRIAAIETYLRPLNYLVAPLGRGR